MFFYTYVLKSKKDKDLYAEFTSDLKSRIEKHNLGKVTATKKQTTFEVSVL